MADNDLNINSEDLKDVFLDPGKTSKAGPENPAKVNDSCFVRKTDPADTLRKNEEIKNTSFDDLPGPDISDEDSAAEFLGLFEEVSNAIKRNIALFAPEEYVERMMLRTLEKTALIYKILKDTNWDAGGNLKENGTPDLKRFIDNLKKFSPGTEEEDTAEDFSSLLFLRIKTIKTAAGNVKYEEAKEKVTRKIRVISAGYRKNIVLYMNKNIIGPAFKRADTE